MSNEPKRDYDTAFKQTLLGVDLFMRELVDARVVRWQNVELPEVRNPRVDVLGETDSGDLVHIEAQSRNDPDMALRMAEYGLRIYRAKDRFPIQIVLYFGEAKMSMPAEFRAQRGFFSYRLVDVRSFAAQPLLESSSLDDNIFALLARLDNPRGAVRTILQRIVELPVHLREDVFRRVVVLSGLRKKVEPLIHEEARKMPITEDIMDHGIIGPRIREGIALGRKEGLIEGKIEGREEGRIEGRMEGRAEGLAEGQVEGELAIITDLIAQRFGTSPPWVSERLCALNAEQLRMVALRIAAAQSVDDLFE